MHVAFSTISRFQPILSYIITSFIDFLGHCYKMKLRLLPTFIPENLFVTKWEIFGRLKLPTVITL